MLSKVSISMSKRIVFLLVPLNLFIITIFLIKVNDYEVDDIPPIILNQFSRWNNDDYSKPVDTYNSKGYSLNPGKVQFKFVNPKKKKGTPAEVLSLNKQKYEEVMSEEIYEPKDYNMDELRSPEDITKYKHANATIIVLARNSEAASIGKTIKNFEKAFNSKFNYPYTFLNDEPFTDRFKQRMQKLSSAPMIFSTIPESLWKKPTSIDAQKERKAMEIMAHNNIAYAKKQSYHNMCRFYSGNFYNVPELQKFKFYWRIEPNVQFYTNIKYDVFKYMEKKKKKYGFTINLYDIPETIETLWPETLNYLNQGDNYKYVNPNGAFQWVLENQQNPRNNKITQYSTCHFWSNFEIADMDFYRSDAYNEWFKYLDSTGKFYYERWGDAPVHSMGLALFADKQDIHWFRDIGYFHDPYVNCPKHKDTKGCNTGEFSRWGHLADQNCMASWIDYAIDEKQLIY